MDSGILQLLDYIKLGVPNFGISTWFACKTPFWHKFRYIKLRVPTSGFQRDLRTPRRLENCQYYVRNHSGDEFRDLHSLFGVLAESLLPAGLLDSGILQLLDYIKLCVPNFRISTCFACKTPFWHKFGYIKLRVPTSGFQRDLRIPESWRIP